MKSSTLFLPSNTNLQAFKSAIQDFVAANRPNATLSDIVDIFSTGVTAHAAATYRADNLALVRWKVFDGDVELGENEPISKAFRIGFDDTIRRSELSLCFRGANLLYQKRQFPAGVTNLRWINFALWDVDAYTFEGLRGFNIYPSHFHQEALPKFIPVQDAVFWHLVDFEDDFDGVSPVEVAFLQAGMEVEIASTALAFFQNMAIPATIFMPDKDAGAKMPNEDDVDDLVGFLRRVVRGARNFGRSLVSPVRWEVNRLQADFDELAMPELNQQAAIAIHKVLRVPLELLMPSASNYAQAKEARLGWIENWMVPQAEWYASIFTQQVASRSNARWRVEPDFVKVPGYKDLAFTRTAIVRQQVDGTLMDLYTAQKTLGLEANPALKGLYSVPGVGIIPVTEIANAWRYRLTIAPSVSNAGIIPGDPIPYRAPNPTESPIAPPVPAKANGYIPDPMYAEWKNWQHIVARKGVGYPFETKALPGYIADGIRTALLAADPNDAMAVDRVFSQALEDLRAATAPARKSQAVEITDEDIIAARDSLRSMGIEVNDARAS